MTQNTTPPKTKDEYKQLERRIRFGLLFAFLILLGALSLYFQLQFHYTIKETGRLNLTAIAESQRNTVDLFLQERVFNILGLFRTGGFSILPSDAQMRDYLESLQQVSDAVIDVGFLNAQGRQIGYAGPYPHLQFKDYSEQPWLKTLLAGEQDYFISDIYTGFRNKPHFTIGVRQVVEGQSVVLRATLDPDKFYHFLSAIHHARGRESFIINKAGLYQLVDPRRGQLFETSEYLPPGDQMSGAYEVALEGDSVLMAHAWLNETDWALIVREPMSTAYADVYRARRIMFVSSMLIILVVIAALWSTSKMLIGKVREHANKKEEMYTQLLHATKMASLGELATGVAHEINNPLAIILATSAVIEDRLNPEFEMDTGPEAFREDLKIINDAVIRARGITQQLLNYGRKNQPRLVSIDVNQLLGEVLDGLKAREFELANIELERRLSNDLPMVMIDPDQMRQVLFNLLNNAGDAIRGAGKITVATGSDKNGRLYIAIRDTGCGMNESQMRRIFDPFFSTKEVGQGTGLGLSVSLAIMESMGGSIEAQSAPGVGSAFKVILPIRPSR